MDASDKENVPSDILTEWMNVIDTASSPGGPALRSRSSSALSLKSMEEEWACVANPLEKVSLSRGSSYGAVFETDSILGILGIQRVSSTNSLGVAEGWELKAERMSRTPDSSSGGNTTTAFSPSHSNSISLEDEPKSPEYHQANLSSPSHLPVESQGKGLNNGQVSIGRKSNIKEFILWCLPSRRTPTSTISSNSTPSRFAGLGKLSQASIEELTLHECFDIDEEEEDEESDCEDDGEIDAEFQLANMRQLTATY